MTETEQMLVDAIIQQMSSASVDEYRAARLALSKALTVMGVKPPPMRRPITKHTDMRPMCVYGCCRNEQGRHHP
jgi:hypothetical protein